MLTIEGPHEKSNIYQNINPKRILRMPIPQATKTRPIQSEVIIAEIVAGMIRKLKITSTPAM